ncbi:hypothetical protein DQ04_05731010 [Trypanosoma grayi]|uniref:hypothetical protein n=1 Tax=Trypanosoma grayi TaxID=71804 RepID=UPI0004F4443D|nr:hypothetical protein DQ04_05731010 [Trypanosoma grayi]KEG09139.1 hypothetical protein DQ04_05731010 [Trypanosoma grayi]
MQGTTRVPQPWSLLAQHRSVRRHNSHGDTHALLSSSSSSCFLSSSPATSGAMAVAQDSTSGPTGAVASLHGAVNDEAVHSPTVSTVSLLWGASLGLDSCRSADSVVPAAVGTPTGGDGIGGEAAALEAGNGFVSRLLKQVRQDAQSRSRNGTEGVWVGMAEMLKSVRTLHLSRCPLCAPQRAPNWWTTLREEKQRRYEAGNSAQSGGSCRGQDTNKRKRDRASCEGESAESHNADSSTSTRAVGNGTSREEEEEEEEEQQKQVDVELLCAEASDFLEHVYARRERLAATRPAMYAACAETHALRQACDALGGIVLLEALLLGM